MKGKYLTLISIILLTSCLGRNKEPDRQSEQFDRTKLNAIEFKRKVEKGVKEYKKWDYSRLNDEASEIYGLIGKPNFKDDSVFLDVALLYLDRAIELNSVVVTAYQNKYNIVASFGRYREALKLMQKINSLSENFAYGYLSQGLIYEKLNNLDSANYCYKKAYDLYTLSIKIKPDINDLIHRVIVLELINQKDLASKELDRIILKYPDNKFAKAFKVEFINKFDRGKFIDENIP